MRSTLGAIDKGSVFRAWVDLLHQIGFGSVNLVEDVVEMCSVKVLAVPRET